MQEAEFRENNFNIKELLMTLAKIGRDYRLREWLEKSVQNYFYDCKLPARLKVCQMVVSPATHYRLEAMTLRDMGALRMYVIRSEFIRKTAQPTWLSWEQT